jgi:ubiquinone/menaquinone biosynthesis C-methylase UbiE
VDLLPDRIEEARERYPDLRFIPANAEALDFPDASFDLVLFFTVFSSILDAGMRARVAREAGRVLRPGGAVLWYDFRVDSPSNPNVRGIRRDAVLDLFPGYDASLRSVTLLPPLARRLGALTRALYPALAALPFLRTHWAGVLVKPAG